MASALILAAAIAQMDRTTSVDSIDSHLLLDRSFLDQLESFRPQLNQPQLSSEPPQTTPSSAINDTMNESDDDNDDDDASPDTEQSLEQPGQKMEEGIVDDFSSSSSDDDDDDSTTSSETHTFELQAATAIIVQQKQARLSSAFALKLQLFNEMKILHAAMVKLYEPYFPKLNSILGNISDFAMVLKHLLMHPKTATSDSLSDLNQSQFNQSNNGFQDSLSNADLRSVLSHRLEIAVVDDILTNYYMHSLPIDDQSIVTKLMHIIDQIKQLDDLHLTCLQPFFVSETQRIAPNLSALLETKYASELVQYANGIEKLACMPWSAVLSLGQSLQKNSSNPHAKFGLLRQMSIIQSLPQESKQARLARRFAAKAVICARVDVQQLVLSASDPQSSASTDGKYGAQLRYDLLKKIVIFGQTGELAPLPIPGRRRIVRRGGRRARALKMRLQESTAAKAQRYVELGKSEHQDDLTGISYGLLGENGQTSLSINTRNSFRTIGKQRIRQLRKQQRLNGRISNAFAYLVGLKQTQTSQRSFYELKSTLLFQRKKSKNTTNQRRQVDSQEILNQESLNVSETPPLSDQNECPPQPSVEPNLLSYFIADSHNLSNASTSAPLLLSSYPAFSQLIL